MATAEQHSIMPIEERIDGAGGLGAVGVIADEPPKADSFESLAEDLVARPLPITSEHAIRAGLMPVDHRDPFDRMLAAQAEIEGLQLVTRDPAFGAFDVQVVL